MKVLIILFDVVRSAANIIIFYYCVIARRVRFMRSGFMMVRPKSSIRILSHSAKCEALSAFCSEAVLSSRWCPPGAEVLPFGRIFRTMWAKHLGHSEGSLGFR